MRQSERLEMPERDAVEWRASDGTRFVSQRLKPGVLLVQITGDDRGALGDAPFVEIERELVRYQPLQLFFDLRDAAGAATTVRDAWTSWFQKHRQRLKRVSILASSRFINLAVEVAKLFSRTDQLIQIYSDQGLFEQAIAIAVGRPVQLPPSLLAPPSSSPVRAAVDVVREVLSDRSVRLASSRCSWLFERLRPAVLLVTVHGYDDGQFGDRLLDEVNASLGRLPLSLFIDARGSSSASSAASDPWTEWFAANRTALARVVVLTTARDLRLTLAIASHRSQTTEILRITDDAGDFERTVAALVPGFALASG